LERSGTAVEERLFWHAEAEIAALRLVNSALARPRPPIMTPGIESSQWSLQSFMERPSR
jgi:hypothetical protein